MRKAIAMSRSKREIPHYYLTETADLHDSLLRRRVKARAKAMPPINLNYIRLVVKKARSREAAGKDRVCLSLEVKRRRQTRARIWMVP